MVLSRRFPPKSYSIGYKEIASIEHKRLVDRVALFWGLICIGIAYAFNVVQVLKDIVAAFVTGINLAITYANLNAYSIIQWITALFIIISGYYMVKFIISLLKRMVVYRSGKEPIGMPMPLTGKALQTLMEVNKRVKETGGVSKIEVERLIDERVTGLIDERIRMQDELIGSMKKALVQAKTEEEKAQVREQLEAGVEELKSKDEVIESELKKTGLTKEEIFKKYRIKAPDENFIESMLRGDL